MNVLNDFIGITREEFDSYAASLEKGKILEAAERIISAAKQGHRLHVTGVGKPAHVAGYAASLFSSIGLPTYFLHGTEAVHGSCGQLAEGDLVICISNSGETTEMKATVRAIRDNGCIVIAITGNRESWLGRNADLCLWAGVKCEGGVLNRAPRASILAETYMIQCLSVALQEHTKLTPQKYVKFHPGGALGKLRDDELATSCQGK